MTGCSYGLSSTRSNRLFKLQSHRAPTKGHFFWPCAGLASHLPGTCRTICRTFSPRVPAITEVAGLARPKRLNPCRHCRPAMSTAIRGQAKRKCWLIFDLGLASPANGRFGQCLQGCSRFFEVRQVRQGSGKPGNKSGKCPSSLGETMLSLLSR